MGGREAAGGVRAPHAAPYLIGLTGNIACGKSTVLAQLAEYGAEVIDADRLVHELQRPGEPVWAAIREEFGPGVVAPDGALDRRALAALVFGASHLGAVSTLVPLTAAIVIRTILLNALGGVVFGWWFWQRHLEAAMLAHAGTHVGLACAKLLGAA